jgi:Amt family ammonium transporter
MSPGLAFFEAGLLQSKNMLSILTQIISGNCILSFMWNLFGYSLVFGGDAGGIIGNFSKSLMFNVSYFDCYVSPDGTVKQS